MRKTSLILGLVLLLLSGARTLYVSRSMTRSIRASTEGAATLASGEEPNMDDSHIKELSELRNSLLSASELLQAQNRAKRDFVANMSHELRTPLGIVLGMTELLSKNLVPESESERSWGVVKRNGQHLLQIINDILDFSKAEVDHLSVEPAEFSLPELLLAIVEDFRAMANQKNLELKITIDENAPNRIYTDPVRIRQIISNLLANALKFTEQGYIDVRLHAHNDTEVKITVKDTGVGIPESQITKLFTAFTQGDNSPTRRYGGTGLGLSLSRKIGRTLGGDVLLVGSKPGIGSEFEVTFKQKLRLVEFSNAPEVGSKKQGTPRKGLNILLAEDSPDNVALIKIYLKKLELNIDCAVNGGEAVKLATTNHYDLILMDIQMPELDGFDATEKIRAAGVTVPIIALTAHALAEHKDKALQVGFTDYLTKPIDQSQLLTTISRYSSESPLT